MRVHGTLISKARNVAIAGGVAAQEIVEILQSIFKIVRRLHVAVGKKQEDTGRTAASTQTSPTEIGGLIAVRSLEIRGAHLARSEEHTSELQSRQYLVCRLLLEKKKKQKSSSYFCEKTIPL